MDRGSRDEGGSSHGPSLSLTQPITRTDLELYYGNLVKDLDIDIRYESGKGKGVYVTKDVDAGKILFVDTPLVAMQSCKADERRLLMCEECFGFIDASLEDHVSYFVTGRVCEKNKSIIECPGSCSTYYCSSACRRKSWEAHHMLMCEGQKDSPEAREWMEHFYQHARQTNDIFILAAKAMSSIMLHAQRLLVTLTPEQALCVAWEPYRMGYKQVWWESVARPDDVPASEEAQFRSDIKELALDSFTLFLHAIELGHPQIYNTIGVYLLRFDIWGSLIGMFELNNLSIMAIGPGVLGSVSETLVTHVHPCNDNECREIVEEMLNAVLEGTGFYPLHSCMNHSCVPNCRVLLPPDPSQNSKAIIESLKPISAGTELTVSYIDENENCDERQKQLQDYGFVCTCAKCLAHE